LKEKGVDFSRSYVSNSLCCPSRATFLTGQYSHNTGVMDNNPPDSGVRAFMPVEGEALPVRLKEAGYSTGYIGRYLTGYDGSYSPPGWDWWHGMSLDGGDFVGFGHDGKKIAGEHHVDYMADQAASFIERAQGPFYLQVATLSPYRIYPEMATTYPDRYAGAFPDLKAPKPSSFNESDVSDKPSWVRQLPRLSLGKIDAMDRLYRDQARAMLAVDDLLGMVRSTLGAKGVSDSTYVVFTSDNGSRRASGRPTSTTSACRST
jgi:N-acetylglucosamine-6-sulfatase